MYNFDKKQIKEITDYIFLEDEISDILPADVIFIPGCARPEHTEEAARLYHKGCAPLLIPSGGYTKLEGGFKGVKGGGDRYGTDYTCEADFLTAVLMANEVPKDAILPEREATYTLENAEKTRTLLSSQGLLADINKAIICCKAYHARRCYMYYHMVFPKVDIRIHPVVVDGVSRDSWHRTAQGRQIVLSEFSRVGQQLLMMEGRLRYAD